MSTGHDDLPRDARRAEWTLLCAELDALSLHDRGNVLDMCDATLIPLGWSTMTTFAYELVRGWIGAVIADELEQELLA